VKDLVIFLGATVRRLKALVHGIEAHHARVEVIVEQSVTSLRGL
jgi:hypothetical protein